MGTKFAIADIDWFITYIPNQDHKKRYLVIEEKNVGSSDSLLIGSGEFRSYKEFTTIITNFPIPLLVVFIKEEDISQGVYVYRFNADDEKEKSLWKKIGKDWYINVKSKAEFLSEKEFEERIRDLISEK